MRFDLYERQDWHQYVILPCYHKRVKEDESVIGVDLIVMIIAKLTHKLCMPWL